MCYTSNFEPQLSKSEHIALEMQFCISCPDSRLHTTPHLIIFSNADGTRACVASCVTGTLSLTPQGPLIFEAALAAIYRLRKSRIVECRKFLSGAPPF